MTVETMSDIDSEMRESLQLLLSTNRDGAEIYKAAVDAVENLHYKQIFRDYADQRERFVTELTHVMNRYGSIPDDGKTFFGEIHKVWMNIRDAFSRGDSAILAECELSEEAAVAMYKQEASKDLPENVKKLLRTQLTLLENGRQRLQRLGKVTQRVEAH